MSIIPTTQLVSKRCVVVLTPNKHPTSTATVLLVGVLLVLYCSPVPVLLYSTTASGNKQ